MMRANPSRPRAEERGIALVAALLILFLITALGVIALITSESDVKIVSNLDRGKRMFFLAEQTVDRVLMHLHYHPEGLYKLLKIRKWDTSQFGDPGTGPIELPPFKVLDSKEDSVDVFPLEFNPAGDPYWIQKNSQFKIEAAIDLKNWEPIAQGTNPLTGESYRYTSCYYTSPGFDHQVFDANGGADTCGYVRPGSNPFRILVRLVDQNGYAKVFAAEVAVKSAFDFAWYAQDLAQDLRQDPNYVLPRCARGSGEYPYYSCNTVFHHRGNAWVRCQNMHQDGYCDDPNTEVGSRIIGDTVVGDVYLGGENDLFLVRGKPWFQGEVWWRRRYPYRMQTAGEAWGPNTFNQTLGGALISQDSAHPRMAGGVKTYAREIRFFEDNYATSIWGPVAQGQSEQATYRFWVLRMADVEIGTTGRYPLDAGYGAVRVLFRHDLDSNADGKREEPHLWMPDGQGGFQYRDGGTVASAITPLLNNGQVDVADEPGYMAVWEIPWGASWYYDGTVEGERAALYGGNVKERVDKMTQVFNTAQFGNHPPVAISGQSGSWWVIRRGSECNYNPYPQDPTEASVFYFRVPSQGESCGTTPYAGIIYSGVDTILSGVLDGKVSLFVRGDLVLDHEIEYEKDPLKFPMDVGPQSSMDMLAIFAEGDVVVPNSYPDRSKEYEKDFFVDDWSDAYQGGTIEGPKRWMGGRQRWDPFNSESIFAPQGLFDYPQVIDDDGSEDIHAVIASWGYECHTFRDPSNPSGIFANHDCDPAKEAVSETYKQEVANFRVGFHARARTYIGEPGPNGQPKLDGEPFVGAQQGQFYFMPMGNQSGPLRVIGAILQRVAGRVAFDYHNNKQSTYIRGLPAWVNSRCSRGFSEYRKAPSAQDTIDWEGSRPCNVMGHEAFEITYDPRLKLTLPPSPFDSMGRTDITDKQGLLWHPFGQAAYEVISWTEMPGDTDISVDTF